MLQRKSKPKPKSVIQREYDDKLELSVLHAECLRIYFNLRASIETIESCENVLLGWTGNRFLIV